ncbi:MAG: hypothetical protein LKJ86_08155, partial [Oscillibacter sp.]|nr:hypothetical protein [Oscillibacter sp.]
QTSKTIDAIVKTFAKEGYKISTTSAKEMQDIFKQAATFPTGYFEAKPQRAVGFEEVVVAAIPDDLMDRFEQRLKDAGVQNVVAYKTGDDADRMRAVNAFDGVKFSLKDRSPEAMVGKLQEMNQYLREQMTITKGAKTDSEAVDTIAGSLLKDYSSSYDRSALTGRIQALFDWIANGKDSAGNELTWNGLKDEAVSIAGDVLDESLELNDDMYRDYKYLRDKVRTTKLLVPENLRSEIYGGYDDFRKANFGKMQLSGKDGLPVDVFFQELSGLYPEFFDEAETMHPADQLSRIADVLNDLQPVYENRFSGNRQAAEYLADDLIERFYETPQQKPTFADRQQASKSDAVAKERLKNADLRQQAKQDKADASLAGQMAQGRKDAKILRTATNRASRQQARLETRLEALRKQKNERIDTIRKQGREAVKQAQADARQRREETVKAITEKYRGKEQTGREKRSNAARRRQIARHCKDLSQKLLNPSDKRHVPETLRGPVAAMLESINQESAYELEYSKDGKYHRVKPGESRFSEITNRTSAFRKLKEAYAAVLKDGSSGIVLDPSLFGSDVDGVQGNFDKVLSMENIPLADMNGEQLETVWQVVRAVEQSINNAGKVLSGAKFQATTEWADAIAADTASRRDKRSITKNHVLLDMETPYTFFSHYGESGKAIYRMLRDAQDRQQIMVDEAADAISGIVKPKQVQAFEKETHQFTTERGDTLTLNTAQCMEIYELMKREQAQDHLMKGGIVQPEIKSAKIRRGTDSILLSANDLAQIVGVLTDEQTSIADAMQKLTTGMLAGWGNEASMAAYGYKKFTAKDYWPIKSAKEEVHSSVEKGGNNPRSIKNIGMAQSVMPHASNALDVRGIFDTFSSHTGDMADYAAWLLPMEDANRLYNFRYKTADGYTGKTVKGILDRVGGTGSQSYWRDLMEDIQNGIGGNNDSRMASTVGKIIGNAKGAAVGGNIRVVIQQPTAFFRAAVVLSPENMAKGLAAGATKGNGWKKALQYSGIAMRKDQGGFEISSPLQMGEILFDKRSGLRKVSDAFSWAAGKADAVTWGRMWNACEWQTKQTHKNLDVGSKAFYDETEKLFAEVIDQSQVVDGVLQRSQIMRSSNALNKQATAFMGEPTMSFNLMLRAWDQLRYENNPQKRASAIKHLGRAATALVVTDIVNSLAQSIADAERDDDDDKKYWERFWAAFTGITGDEETPWEKAQAFILGSNVMDNMNPLGRIPYVKDMLSLLQGYKVTRMDADVIADILDAAQTVADSAGGNGKKTRAYAVKELANQVGKLFGISGGNILRDVWGIARSAAVETDNLPLQYEMERAIYNISHDANKSRYMDLLFKAKQSGDKETYKRIHDDVIAAGITDDDKIADAMNDRYKKTDAYSSAQEGLASSQTALLQRNGQYGRMNAEYQEKADDWLTGYSKAKALAQTSPDYEMSKQYQKMDDLSKSGVEPWKYALFRAALAMQDDQNKDVEKRNGSYDKAEIQAAADSLPGLTQATKDKLIAAAKG